MQHRVQLRSGACCSSQRSLTPHRAAPTPAQPPAVHSTSTSTSWQLLLTCGSKAAAHTTTAAATRHLVALRASSNDSSSSGSSGSSSSSSQVSVAVSTPEEPRSAPTSASSSSSLSAAAAAAAAGGGSAKDAMLARIARAKAYKQQPADTPDGSSSSSGSSSGSSSSQLSDEQQEVLRQQYIQTLQQAQAQAASQGSDYNNLLQQQQQQQQAAAAAAGGGTGGTALDMLEQADPSPGARPPPARADFYTNPDAPEVMELLKSAPKKAGTGSEDEAADWLKGVLSQQQGQQLDPTMRPEEFTAAKEAVVKSRGAEIITAFPEEFEPGAAAASGGDAAAAAAVEEDTAAAASPSGEQPSEYKPKVTTWGVFPRPQNISQAYGGGRNIRPGQALETPEEKAKREEEYAAALLRFKKATYTDALSDSELAQARATFDEGMQLFKRGAIAEALTRFDEVREKVPLKSRLGGLSTLQAAVCYDTLGNGRQAEALYKRIQGHPTAEVSRKAKQLVFGFQAMTFLKTHNLNYAVKKEDYLKYFRRSADRNRMYVASEEERAADQAEAQKAAAVALGVVLGPVVIMGALLASMKL